MTDFINKNLGSNLFRNKVIRLILMILAIKLISINEAFVETWYSSNFYIIVSKILRTLTGWLPFSLGDIIYLLATIVLIAFIVRGIRNMTLHKHRFYKYFPYKKFLIILLWIYIIFNLSWGINYNRMGIAHQLKMKVTGYSLNDLKLIEQLLLVKVNESRQALDNKPFNYPNDKELFRRARNCYDSASKTLPFLNYKPSSLKSSLYGRLGNYLGFSGYYNPFSGEAQVNTTVPKFLIPYTTCHEMGHQLGYAKEMEANFVGYLTATSGNDTLFRYSAYLDLLVYSTRELSYYDSSFAKASFKQLIPSVKNDLAIVRKFWRQHQNPVEPVISWMYGKYLKANKQPRGMQSYNEVTADLIAYYKKYGKI